MNLHVLRALKDNYVYVLENGREAAVVDPGDATPVLAFLQQRNLRLSHILATHHHWDHVNGIAELYARYQPEVVASRYDQFRVPHASHAVDEAHPFALWGETVRVLDVPGHTLGQVAYLVRDMLFVGDTLFSAGCGRLFEGTPAQMFASLQKFKTLSPDTRIYFGHEYTSRNLEFVLAREPRPEVIEYRDEVAHLESTTPTTIERELALNPFLRARDVPEFAAWRAARDTF